MDERKFIKKCKEFVKSYYNDRVESIDKNGKITTDDVFVIWFCKTLQNSKALLSTNVPDGMYYEITYNGDKNVMLTRSGKTFLLKYSKEVRSNGSI